MKYGERGQREGRGEVGQMDEIGERGQTVVLLRSPFSLREGG